jgi:lysophospholipase L1-like esterase
MYDVRYFLEELVLRHEPRAVMIYEGDNDVALGSSLVQVILHFAAIVEQLHVKLPKTRIYIFAVKPRLARWHLWPVMQETNQRLLAFSQRDPLVTFVDIATPMLVKNGKPPSSIFVEDMLHMNDGGYDIWRDAVRSVLIDAEVQHE